MGFSRCGLRGWWTLCVPEGECDIQHRKRGEHDINIFTESKVSPRLDPTAELRSSPLSFQKPVFPNAHRMHVLMNKQVYQVKNLQSTASYSDAENSEKQVRRIMLHALSGRGEGVYGGEVRPIEKAYIETQYSARLERAMSITR